MKLVLPLAGIVLGSGVCCCGESDFIFDLMDGIRRGVEENTAEARRDGTTVTVTDGDVSVTATTNGGAATAGSGGSDVAGLCGRFATLGVQAPSGFHVVVCNDDAGGPAALILTGSGDPGVVCEPFKGWVARSGYDIQTGVGSDGSYSIAARKDGKALHVVCANTTGPTLITISLGP